MDTVLFLDNVASRNGTGVSFGSGGGVMEVTTGLFFLCSHNVF